MALRGSLMVQDRQDNGVLRDLCQEDTDGAHTFCEVREQVDGTKTVVQLGSRSACCALCN